MIRRGWQWTAGRWTLVKKPIIYDFNNVMSGRTPHGISFEELESYEARARAIHALLSSKRRNGELPFYDLPYRVSDVTAVKNTVKEVKKKTGSDLENLLVIGIGGSSLGGIALFKALAHPFHNLLPAKERKAPRIFYAENIDPDEMSALFDALDPEKTVVNIISKSGDTAEPMANFLIVEKMLNDRIGKERARERIVATTDPKKGTMKRIADDLGILQLQIPEGVGGRFSVLCPVGLFPASMAGIDIDAILEGAALMDGACKGGELFGNPAYLNAVIHYHLHTRRGVNMAVLMPYSSALAEISGWYRQLLAESLGKKTALSGEIVYAGQTPIKAVGAVDQHSQIQLYREGPFDKIITVLSVDSFGNTLDIPTLHHDYEGTAYLGGHTLNELIKAEKDATILALVKSGKPVLEISLPEINPHSVGQLLYLYEVQTVFAGYLYNVNSLDQPGVEAGKNYAYGLLGRKGYERVREEVAAFPARDRRCVIVAGS
jgi:glucose-6-phosphate isomerase